MNDDRPRYKLWKEMLGSLQAQHARDDSDLALASELWTTYDGGPDNNLKRIPLAIDTFRGSAVESDTGSHALASAVREVHLLTGRLPRRQDLETVLYWATSKSSCCAGRERFMAAERDWRNLEPRTAHLHNRSRFISGWARFEKPQE